ncbi:YqiA/YcfP family alpha/beta fold hydrolase [Chromohalobacter sarecensis]|uniref:YqiA/YcfP family alpha/beta fold hydrolase n=1 Tax=Chromohalobacter sarecensis TaxID=245294 RepID=A0ABV9CWJ2_9GAMM|nr:YqiA/YcfP family alpha/beta fold hydrolase [Chromohalobacter sarecensis]MCK0715481.1 alpha/beta fold hydrolase [Chromohalobacter sarecensis]
MTPVANILYLHGFNSGAASPKARLIAATCERLASEDAAPPRCVTPQLPHRPEEALVCAERELSTLGDDTLLIGSSMGGFLATCLAERFGARAVLINPAVRPARLVAQWMGASLENPYTHERFTIDARHGEALETMTPAAVIDPSRYQVLLGSADETLDCRDALAFYAGASMIVHPGGDHGFSALAEYLPAIFAHGGWTLPVHSHARSDEPT